MGAVTISSLAGKEGSIRIPALGTVIGRMSDWTLKRRGDDGPKEGSYDLRAALSYVNPHLFNHPEYSSKRRIVVTLSKQHEYEVEEGPETVVRLEGNNLTMERITLCHL